MLFNPRHYSDQSVFMETSGLLRHQIIESLTVAATENAADTSIVLWEQMTTQIIAIVGVGGFNSLYARSIFLSQSQYPWLSGSEASLPADQRFAALKSSLARQPPAVAIEANAYEACQRFIAQRLEHATLHDAENTV